MDAHAIQGLYNLAHCYVHPARGEGFGLPVAEAMAAGVPVISSAYSGLADFVSDETASTIPFQLEPAETHFEIPDSVWAEPDRAAARSDRCGLTSRASTEEAIAERARTCARTRSPPNSLGRLRHDGGTTS